MAALQFLARAGAGPEKFSKKYFARNRHLERLGFRSTKWIQMSASCIGLPFTAIGMPLK
jgi:hypothetical protein